MSPSSPSDVNLAYIVHCAKSTCFVRSICLHVSAVFLTKQKSLGWSKTSKHVHIISQQKGAHLMIPNVCCLFFGLHGSLSKGKEIFDSVAWEEGKENLLISPSHARTRAPEFLSPSFSKACHSDLLFFLIVYDVVVTCASFLYPHIIEKKEINQSILKLCFVLSSFFLPSFLPSFLPGTVYDTLFFRTDLLF